MNTKKTPHTNRTKYWEGNFPKLTTEATYKAYIVKKAANTVDKSPAILKIPVEGSTWWSLKSRII